MCLTSLTYTTQNNLNGRNIENQIPEGTWEINYQLKIWG